MSKIEELFKKWLNTPFGSFENHETIVENIDQNCIKMVEKAFFEGYEMGKKDLLVQNYEEQMQK